MCMAASYYSEADPRISLFLKRYLTVQWGKGCNTWRCGSQTDEDKAQKKFDKLVLERRTPQEIQKADQFWSACETDFDRFQEELAKLAEGDDLWNSSASLKALRTRIHSKESQQHFKPSDFSILRRLGKGGWGTVYKAVHLPTGHVVALKEIEHKSSSVETKDQRMLPLDCGVVPCYGTFLATNANHSETLKTWMVLKFCSGGSLGDRIVHNGVLSPKEAAPILKRVSKVTSYLHSQHGIVHNDIKSHNILFDADGTILVCDLGVARKGLWQTEQRMGGTFSHMSPEKLTGRKLANGKYLNDEKIDVWALGILLCEMLFSAHPYKFDILASCPTVGRETAEEPSTPQMVMDLMESTYGAFDLPENKNKYIVHADQRSLLKDLFEKMLNIDFLERMSLAEIKKHPWVKQHSGNWTNRALSNVKMGFHKHILMHTKSHHQAHKGQANEPTPTHSTISASSRRRLSELLDAFPSSEEEVIVGDC